MRKCASALFAIHLGASMGFHAMEAPMWSRQRFKYLTSLSVSSSQDYLSSLSQIQMEQLITIKPTVSVSQSTIDEQLPYVNEGGPDFSHASLTYFEIENLIRKGPRNNADVGQPEDSTLKLVDLGEISCGSWWCSAGGWPSPTQRDTTEVFHVLTGHGCVTDLDGTKHYFGPGSTVILPKGWSGRWDVLQDIHKVWFIHDHPRIEETSYPIHAVITHHNNLAAPHLLESDGIHPNATGGSIPSTYSSSIYSVGRIDVGGWMCTPGSFDIHSLERSQCFHVLEGEFFLTCESGGIVQGKWCRAGSTLVLPKGWSGQIDVMESVRTLKVEV